MLPEKPDQKSDTKKSIPLTPDEQCRRFEELARELECDESEENFDAALRVIAKQKPKSDKKDLG